MADKEDTNERAGSLAGLGAGALTGAQIGTSLMPGVGTFTGALVGGIVGSQIGKTVGGVVLGTIFPGGKSKSTATQDGGDDLLMQLEHLNRLRNQGALSEEEFRAAKARLLGL